MVRRSTLFVVIAILLVAAALTTGIATASAPPAGAATVAAAPRAKDPSTWDPRILPLVKFAEKARKLTFEHPIPVEFLTDAQFRKRVRNDDQKVTAADRRDTQRAVEEIRALGLVVGPVDLIGAEKDLSGADTLGYYDQDAKKMVIRGKDLKDTETRVTVVHELTHTLQDQHFNLNKLSDATKTSGEDTALTALIEGDATRVEDKYLASLSKKEQDAYDEALQKELDANKPGAAGTDLAGVPPILGLLDEAPYDFGEPFVDTLAAKNGVTAIDGAFRHPPTSEQQIIDPVVYFDNQSPLKVAVPKLDAGDKRQGSPDDFGALSLFVMLDSRGSFADALRAAEAWGGDRYVSFRRGGHTCVRIATRGRSNAATRTLGTALQAWAAAGPANSASVAVQPRLVTLTACDLGGGTAPSFDDLSGAVDSMTGRVEIVAPGHRGGRAPGGRHLHRGSVRDRSGAGTPPAEGDGQQGRTGADPAELPEVRVHLRSRLSRYPPARGNRDGRPDGDGEPAQVVGRRRDVRRDDHPHARLLRPHRRTPGDRPGPERLHEHTALDRQRATCSRSWRR